MTQASDLQDWSPGAVLDLGCGEGGDAIWLAEHGWQLTAVDVSTTARERAAAQPDRVGVAARVTFEAHDMQLLGAVVAFGLVRLVYPHVEGAEDDERDTP